MFIDDNKHVFMFVLGIFCDFAISRVKVSSIIVFPASVLVFVLLGFTVLHWVCTWREFNEFNVNAIKRKVEEEFYRVSKNHAWLKTFKVNIYINKFFLLFQFG